MVRAGMQQIKVALPDQIRGYLDEVAAKNERNLSEEVRARLDQSVVDDRFDEQTKEFGRDAMWLAHLRAKGSHSSNWMTNRRLIEEVKASLDTWFSDHVKRLGLPDLSDDEMREAKIVGEANARGYAELKPMLIKHRPGGDNMEGKQ